MNLAAAFSEWVKDPRRTNDELFLAELLIEAGHQAWRTATKAPWSRAYYDQLEARRAQRALDPAYRPKLSAKKLAHTVEVWAQIERVATEWREEHRVRDLSALRFFPHLTEVKIHSELRNLSGLEVLKGLRKLELDDDTLVDFSPLTKHARLEELTLKLEWPWPEISELEKLPLLRRLDFSGNVLVFAGVARLPTTEFVQIGNPYQSILPLRELTQLPEMPRVRELRINATASLRGLERYPLLERLTLQGPFEDLTPIVSLQNLRELTLWGERFSDLAPLARLPRLRTLELQRERGLDLTPLSESPGLRQVKSRCKVLETELATLNAALGFIDESDFLAPEPRPLRPLRYISCRQKDPEYKAVQRKEARNEREEVFGDDPLYEPAERHWFEERVKEKLANFGDPKWMRVVDLHSMIMVELYRVQEAANVRQMVEAMHPLLNEARFKWEILFAVDLDGKPEEEDEDERPDDSVFDVEREREEWEEGQQYAKERQEKLEREHQMQLQQQQGVLPAGSPVSNDEDEQEITDKTPDETSVDPKDDDEGKGFVDDRCFRLWMDGDIVWLDEQDLDDAAEFLHGVRVEDWHKLPEPPEQRPRWRCW